ncbi:hypothetical protein D9M68_650250 [compost metagenome]
MFAAKACPTNDAIRLSILVLLPWQQCAEADVSRAADVVLGCCWSSRNRAFRYVPAGRATGTLTAELMHATFLVPPHARRQPLPRHLARRAHREPSLPATSGAGRRRAGLRRRADSHGTFLRRLVGGRLVARGADRAPQVPGGDPSRHHFTDGLGAAGRDARSFFRWPAAHQRGDWRRPRRAARRWQLPHACRAL